MKTYLVGGAVRDHLLQRPIKDRDYVVVGSTVQEMLDLGYKQVGADFPVFLHPETGEEYALARTERKSGTGYHGFQVHADENVTLEDDLRRRDFTMNAMAMEFGSLTVIDPFDGRLDINDRIIRHVSEAFAEDPVRVLRCARFAARYHDLKFTVHPSTVSLMTDMVDRGELNHLTVERVWKEIEAAMQMDNAHVFFEVLSQCGALEVVLPEVDQIYGISGWYLDERLRLSAGQSTAIRMSALGLFLTDPPTDLAARLKLPTEVSRLMEASWELIEDLRVLQGMWTSNGDHLSKYTDTIERLFKHTRALSQGSILDDLLAVYRIEMAAHENLSELPDAARCHMTQFLHGCLERCRTITAANIDPKFVGAAIGVEIRRLQKEEIEDEIMCVWEELSTVKFDEED